MLTSNHHSGFSSASFRNEQRVTLEKSPRVVLLHVEIACPLCSAFGRSDFRGSPQDLVRQTPSTDVADLRTSGAPALPGKNSATCVRMQSRGISCSTRIIACEDGQYGYAPLGKSAGCHPIPDVAPESAPHNCICPASSALADRRSARSRTRMRCRIRLRGMHFVALKRSIASRRSSSPQKWE